MSTRADQSREGSSLPAFQLRTEVFPSDVEAVRSIAQSSGFFSAEEIEIAVELIEERLKSGPEGDYRFIVATSNDEPIGFTCYGSIPCTQASYDLYWIAVHESHRNKGVGRVLMEEAERHIARQGGRRVYVETSSRALYEPTREFYRRCGYVVDAVQNDFYAPGDGKVTLVKPL